MAIVIGWLKCQVLGHAEPARVPLGWRCPRCQAGGASLGDFDGNWGGGGWVNPKRQRFSRYRHFGRVGV